MLSSTGDRAHLKGLIREAEQWSLEALKEVPLEAVTTRFAVVHSGTAYAEAAAVALYWLLKVLAPDIEVELHSAEGELYHTIAYEKGEPETGQPKSIVMFAEEGAEGVVARIMDASKLLRARLLVVAPPLPPLVTMRAPEDAVVVETPPGKGIHMMIFAVRLGLELARRASGAVKTRIDRLLAEVKDFSSIVDELAARYRDTLLRLAEIARSREPLLIGFTPTMRGAAAVLESILDDVGTPTKRAPLTSILTSMSRPSRLRPYKFLTLLYTDVEEDVAREVKFKLTMRLPPSSLSLVELRLRTDPLTAPVYACILLENLRFTLGGAGMLRTT